MNRLLTNRPAARAAGFVAAALLVAAAAWAQTATPAAAADDVNYRIGARDLLAIQVFGVPELNTEVRVAEDGSLSLPLIGEIRAAGLTQSELARLLAERLEKDALRNPQVTVFIREYQGRKVSVMGAVAHPGEYDLAGRQTLLQLLSRVGVTPETASDQVVVMRGGERLVIDRNALMFAGDPTLNIEVRPGDIVNIPVQEYIDVYVFGQVQRPGTVKLKKNVQAGLLKAIALAGGFTERARRSSVVVRRLKGGQESRTVVNAAKIIRGSRPDFPLENEDVVHVGESLL